MALEDPMQPWSWIPPSWASPVPDPLAIEAGEYGSTVIGSPVPLPPPPPPPPPPPQQLGPVGLPPPVDEIAMPAMPTATQAAAVPAEIEMPPDYVGQDIEMPADYVGAPLPAVGSGIDANGMPLPDMPAMPGVDAVSGVNAMPLPADMPVPLGSMPAPVPQLRTGDNGQPSLTEDELLRLYQNDPVAYAAYNEQQNAQRDAKVRETEAMLAKEQATRAEQDWADYQKAKVESDAMLRQLDADAAALAAEKPTRYEPSILDVAAAVLGMIGAPATGGKNVGLEMVQNRIEQHAQQQREEYNRKKDGIAGRQNAYARLRAAGYDDFQATNAFRMASYARAKEQLLTEAQNFDPQGTTARRIAGAAIQMDQQIKQAQVAGQKADLEKRLSLAELRKKQADALIAEKKAGLLGGTGAGGSVKPGNLTGAQVTAMLPPGSDPVPDKPGGYSPVEAKSRVDLAGAVTGEDRKTNKLLVEGIVDENGQPFVFASDPEAQQFRKQKAAIGKLNALIGELATDIEQKGGTVGFVNSGLNKKYESKIATIDLILKDAYQTGTLDEGTEKKLKQLKGGNITSMITGGTEGLDTLRDDLVRGFDFDLRAQPGYNGPGYNPPYKPRLPKADAGPDGQRLQQTIKANYYPAKTINKVKDGTAIEMDPMGSKEAVDVHLEGLEKRARKNDDDARDAKETLRAIERDAVSPDVKKRAAEILKSIPMPRGDAAR